RATGRPLVQLSHEDAKARRNQKQRLLRVFVFSRQHNSPTGVAKLVSFLFRTGSRPATGNVGRTGVEWPLEVPPMKRRRVLQWGAAVGGAMGSGLLARNEASARELGRPLGPYGQRSPFEKGVRWTRESKTPEAGSSFTPL